MQKPHLHGAAAVVVLMLVHAHAVDAAPSSTSRAVLTTPYFAFHSDFATNLNQALIADFIARRGGQPALFAQGSDKACFDRLSASDRDGWARAVEYYRTNQATSGQRVLLRLEIAGIVRREAVEDPADRAILDAFARARNDATPAYRRCKWTAQDAVNRAWIARLRPLLEAHSRQLGEELPKLFQKPWSGLPFRVDVVEQVTLGGNTATADSGQPHILVSSTNSDNQGAAALEVVFHEACHYLAQPGGPLSNALNAAATEAGVTLPPDVLHEVHFFIVGEAVRRSFERAGQPYTPDLYRLKLFSDGFRAAAARIWPPYIDGTRTLDEAAADLAAAVKK